MEVTSIQDGIIIDHVPAGTALKVLEYLRIDPATTKLALIMNTTSRRYGSKDIIKIEDAQDVDLDVLGLVARQATVDIIHGGQIVNKQTPTLPERVLRDDHRTRHRPGVLPRPHRRRGVPLPILRRGGEILNGHHIHRHHGVGHGRTHRPDRPRPA